MKLPKLKIGDIMPDLPIIQGGMSVGISLSNLSAAVAGNGGIGIIGAAGIGQNHPDFLKDPYKANIESLISEIRKARSNSKGFIGVNIMKVLSDYDNLVTVAIKEKVDAIFVGAGMPMKLPKGLNLNDFKKLRTKIIPIVSSAQSIQSLMTFWANEYETVPDAVVVEGPEAGGHLGFTRIDIENKVFSLGQIVMDVRKVLDDFSNRFNKQIALIAAGGIFTGKDITNIISKGADGVQMGTRFVGTEECDASDGFKSMYLNCKQEDITLINSPVGLPGRAIKNQFLEDAENSDHGVKCDWKCLRTCKMQKSKYCIAHALLSAKKGEMHDGFAFAGSNAYRVREIVKVSDLMRQLVSEAEAE